MKFPQLTRRKKEDSPATPVDFNTATEQDIYYCYRLLLNREPDEPGWAYWQQMVNERHIPLPILLSGFINGPEFRALQRRQNEPHLVELPQFKMFVRLNDFFIGAVIERHKAYEPHIVREIETLLKPGDVFVDIGANVGYFSLLAATLVAPGGQVLAFEPKPDNCAFLRRSLAVNDFQNVHVYQNAVAEKAETFYFTEGGADSNGRLLHNFEVEDAEQGLRVEAVTLDETLPELPGLKVIKMDIEGAEPRAWQGMNRTIQKYHPTLIMEFSPSLIAKTSLADPAAFLDAIQQQYTIHILHTDGRKSEHPETTTSIMQAQQVAASDHIDLIAYPR